MVIQGEVHCVKWVDITEATRTVTITTGTKIVVMVTVLSANVKVKLH